MHYWIDTDPGVDDAIAIILAVREAGSRIVGLSSVQGNIGEARTAYNLARLVTAMRAHSIVPAEWAPIIARGSRHALVRAAYRSDDYAGGWYHGRDSLGDVDWTAPADWDSFGSPCAANAIVEAARRFPDLCIVCLGPLTNVALAVRLGSDLVDRCARVVVMGGSLRLGGNETAAAEFNFIADAEAADLILTAGFRDLTLIPLDPCGDVRMGLTEWERLARRESAAASLVADLTNSWRSTLASTPGIILYDPAAWLLGNHEPLARWESTYVRVETGNGVARGAMIVDWKGRAGMEANARVATEVIDRNSFTQHFWNALK